MHTLIVLNIMTKMISLSNKAYQTLKDLKRPDESFSDVVLRIAGREHRSILEFSGKWAGDDIDEVFLQVREDRERFVSR